MLRLRWLVVAALGSASFFLAAHADRADAPYVFLTGYSRLELEQLSFLPAGELEARTGLHELPGGFSGDRAYEGRAAHAIASYLGTRRWGPDLTLAFGYMKEYLPAMIGREEVDPGDLAANHAGVAYALEEIERGRP